MKKSPFSAKELKEFQSLLLEKRTRLLKELEGQSEELVEEKDTSGDMVDLATSLLERNISLSLTETEKKILGEIDRALEKIATKTYGLCVDTGSAIGKARLKALPEAARTLEAQEKFDRQNSKKRPSIFSNPIE